MTLHEAIKNVLLNFGNLSVDEITAKVNSHGLYKRKDGKQLHQNQISARIAKYPEMFSYGTDGRLTLRNHSLISLKLTIDKIADTLYQHSSVSVQTIEVLLPAFAIFLNYNNPFNLITQPVNESFDSSDLLEAGLIKKWKAINEGEQFKGLLTKPIEVFEVLDKELQFKIIMNILSGTIQLRDGKYLTQRKTREEYESQDEYIEDLLNTSKVYDDVPEFSKRLKNYGSWGIPVHDFRNFFKKLVNEFSWKKKFSSLQSTPVALAKLIAGIVQAEEFEMDTQYVFLDPFFGKGTLMAEVCLGNIQRNIAVYGGDLDENAIYISRLLFAVNGLKAPEIYQANAFTSFESLPRIADWFICDPPMIPKLSIDQTVFGGYGVTRNTIEAIINMALYHTHETGKACIVVPESFIFSSAKSFKAIRKKLVDDNLLDGIISLPPGIYAPYSSVKTSIIVIDKSRNELSKNWIFVHDASKVKPEELETIIPEITERYAEKGTEYFSNKFFIEKEKIAANDYDFSIQRLTSPLLKGTQSANYLQIAELQPFMNTGAERQSGIISGNSIKKEELSTISGIPYVQIADLSNDPLNCYLRQDSIKNYITSTESIYPRFLKKGSILIAKSGNNLKPTIYEGEQDILFSPSILGFSLNTAIIDSRYFILQLHQQYFIDQLNKIRRGVAVLSFRPEDFIRLKVHVPDIEEQKRVVKAQFPAWNKTGVSRDEINNLIGELKHKAKGPLGGIKLSVTRLENYLSDKLLSGEKIHDDDIAYMMLPGQKKEDFLQYSVEETFKRIYQHIERIDDYFKKAIQFADLGNELAETEPVDLYKLINDEVIPGNQYSFQISIDVMKQARHVLVKANKDRLLTVFELFLDNAFIHAFKSKPDKSSLVNISWEIKGGESLTQKAVIITIENNGVAASGLTLERFITKGHTTNSDNGGLGMGGAFIHKALSLMGGQLISIVDISQKTSEFNIQFIFKLVAGG